MSKNRLLKSYCKIAQIHASRLQESLEKIELIMPEKSVHLDLEALEIVVAENWILMDAMSTRFGKLQDMIGSKVFFLLLDILGESQKTLLDSLYKLEKLEYIISPEWWMNLRELRNEFTHDYPEEPGEIAPRIHDIILKSKELLVFWNEFNVKIKQYMA